MPTREPLSAFRESATPELRREIDAAVARAQEEQPRAPPRPAAPPRPPAAREMPRRTVRDSHPHGHVCAASAMDEDGSITLAYLWLVGEYHRSAIVEAPA